MEKTCSDCKRFVQHYGLIDGRIFKIYCGHCACLKVKTKKPDCKACDNFEQGVKDEDNFVKKEYLTKRLLDHVLNLELLPKIEDYPIQK